MVRRFLSLILIISLVFPELALAVGGRDNGDPEERAPLVSHGPRYGSGNVNGEGRPQTVTLSQIRDARKGCTREQRLVQRLMDDLRSGDEIRGQMALQVANALYGHGSTTPTDEGHEMTPTSTTSDSSPPSSPLHGSDGTSDEEGSKKGFESGKTSEASTPPKTPLSGSPTTGTDLSSSGETPVGGTSSGDSSPRKPTEDEIPANEWFAGGLEGDDPLGSVADLSQVYDEELAYTAASRLAKILDDPEALARVKAGMKHYHRHILHNKETWLQWAARAGAIPIALIAAWGYSGIFTGGTKYLAQMDPSLNALYTKFLHAPYFGDLPALYLILVSSIDAFARDSDLFSRAAAPSHKAWSKENNQLKVWTTRVLRAGLTLPTAALMFFYLYDYENEQAEEFAGQGLDWLFNMYKYGFGPVLAFDGALWAWDNVGHVAELVVHSGKDLFSRMFSPAVPRQQLPSPEMLHKKQLLSDLKLAHYALNILPDGIIQSLYGQIIGIRDAKPDKGIDTEAFAMAQSLQVVKMLSELGKGIHDDRTHSPITLHGCSRVLSGINATLATPARSLVLWYLSHSILSDIVDATDVGDGSPLRMMVMPLAIAAALIMTVPEAFAEYYGVQGLLNIFKPEEPEATHSSPVARAGLNLFSVFQSFIELVPLTFLCFQTLDYVGLDRAWMAVAAFYLVPEFASGAASMADSYSKKWGHIINRIWTAMRRCVGYGPSLGTQRDELLRLTEESQEFVKDVHPGVVQYINLGF